MQQRPATYFCLPASTIEERRKFLLVRLKDTSNYKYLNPFFELELTSIFYASLVVDW